MKHWRPLLILATLLALSACTAQLPPAPTATAQPTPSATSAQSPTATPSPTPDCGPGITLRSDGGELEVYAPCNSAPDGMVLDIFRTDGMAAAVPWRCVGPGYAIGLRTKEADGVEFFGRLALAQPITITLNYTDSDVLHLDSENIGFYYWVGSNSGQYERLPVTVDREKRQVTAQSQGLGYFFLLAPAFCGKFYHDDTDDRPTLQTQALRVNGPSTTDLLDAPKDEDWFALPAATGVTYTIQTHDLAPGVDTALTILDAGGQPLATDDNSGQASRLDWQPPSDGRYYIRVTCAPGGFYGCEAQYSLQVTAPPATLTLHNSGQIERVGDDGGWVAYSPSTALPPGWCYFRFNGHNARLKIGSSASEETVAIVCPPGKDEADGWLVDLEKVEYLDDNGWQPAYPSGFDDFKDGWVCAVPGLHQELTVRVTYQGATMEKTQDIIADPVINLQAGRVHSVSDACTHYYASGEWRPFENDMLLLPLTYTFHFNDGTPDTEYTVAAGEQTDIH